MWKYNGRERPHFALPTQAGQESVWDYPRPPVLMRDKRRVRVYFGDTLLAESSSCMRVLETAGAPTFYIPPQDVDGAILRNVDHRSICEWKGIATYCSVVEQRGETFQLRPCGWQYTDPSAAFAAIKGFYSFYPSILDCFVDEEKVQPQPGGFYGGWVTGEIVGPIKGEPGTEWW